MKRYLLALAGVFALNACMPEADSEITAENALTVLSASLQANNLSEQVKSAESSTRILHRFQSRTSNGETFSCDSSGSMTLELNSASEFSLDFIDCKNAIGRLDGKITGTFDLNLNQEFVSLSYSAKNFESEDALGNVVFFEQVAFVTNADWSPGESYLEYSHGGTYDFDTSAFKGKVNVKTNEINHHPLSDLQQCSGNVTYTDSSGNVLTVDRNGNGIDLYFNDSQVGSYSCLWAAVS